MDSCEKPTSISWIQEIFDGNLKLTLNYNSEIYIIEFFRATSSANVFQSGKNYSIKLDFSSKNNFLTSFIKATDIKGINDKILYIYEKLKKGSVISNITTDSSWGVSFEVTNESECIRYLFLVKSDGKLSISKEENWSWIEEDVIPLEMKERIDFYRSLNSQISIKAWKKGFFIDISISKILSFLVSSSEASRERDKRGRVVGDKEPSKNETESSNKKNWVEKISDSEIIIHYALDDSNYDINITRKSTNKQGVSYFSLIKDWEIIIDDVLFKFESEDRFLFKLLRLIHIYIWDSIEKDVLRSYSREVYKLFWFRKSSHEQLNRPKSLKEKPIDLWYDEIYPSKEIKFLNFPSLTTEQMIKLDAEPYERIIRCLRWKPITDAVEKRYWIPEWLLLAMMAQEWLWDPTLPNILNWRTEDGRIVISRSDWWLWLIHIQWLNASNYWLDTLTLYNKKMRDTKHWRAIISKLRSTKDTKDLIEFDDRWHPIMSVDAAARFLVDKVKSTNKTWLEKWKLALKRYSWREHNWSKWYGWDVFKYWILMKDAWLVWNDQYMSLWVKTKSNDYKSELSQLKDSLSNMKVVIAWVEWGKDLYYSYFEEQIKNYWLDEYISLWEYWK